MNANGSQAVKERYIEPIHFMIKRKIQAKEDVNRTYYD